MNYWVVIYRFAWALLGVLFAIGLTCIFLPRHNVLRELQNKEARLQAENAALNTRIRELRMKQKSFRTEPAFVERTARGIGMVKPGETVFKFTNRTDAIATSRAEK